MTNGEKKTFTWPEGESPPDAQEQRDAAELAQALEGTGQPDAKTGELLAAARMVQASTRPHALPDRQRLLDEVFAAPPRRRTRRWAPVLALAASLVLVIGALLAGLPFSERHAPLGGSHALPLAATSRPSNSLLGQPIEQREAAARRLDLVYADRLAGYRRLKLERWRR